jgi:hypothetical protein
MKTLITTFLFMISSSAIAFPLVGGVGISPTWLYCHGYSADANQRYLLKSPINFTNQRGKPDFFCSDGKPRAWERWVSVPLGVPTPLKRANGQYHDIRDKNIKVRLYGRMCYRKTDPATCTETGKYLRFSDQYRGFKPWPF